MYADNTWNQSELLEEMGDYIDDEIDDFGCGDNVKIKYTILRTYTPTASELKELEDDAYDNYAYYVYKRANFKISDAKLVYISITVTGSRGTEVFTYPDGFLVFKEKGKWRVPFGGISTSWY